MINSGRVEESALIAGQSVLALASVCRFLEVEPVRYGHELYYPVPQIDAAAKILGLLPEDTRQELVEALSAEYLKAYGRLEGDAESPELRDLKQFVLARYRVLLEEDES